MPTAHELGRITVFFKEGVMNPTSPPVMPTVPGD